MVGTAARTTFTGALVALAACGGSNGRDLPAPSFFEGPVPRVIAHRGGADRAPENTIAGFASGLANGTQILEMDVQSTSDGAIVVLHDATVDRTTDGTGPVHGFTLTELKRLDAGHDFGRDLDPPYPYRGTGVTIPTLDEVFRRFPRERFLIEIKQSNPRIEEAVLDVIDRYGMREQVCLAAFDDRTNERVRELAPDLCTGGGILEVVELLLTPIEELLAIDLAASAAQLPFEVVAVPVLGPFLVDKVQRLGLEAHVWTVDDADDMRMLLDLGVDGIITDRPDVARDVLVERGLAP